MIGQLSTHLVQPAGELRQRRVRIYAEWLWAVAPVVFDEARRVCVLYTPSITITNRPFPAISTSRLADGNLALFLLTNSEPSEWQLCAAFLCYLSLSKASPQMLWTFCKTNNHQHHHHYHHQNIIIIIMLLCFSHFYFIFQVLFLFKGQWLVLWPHCPVHNCLLSTVALYLLIAANKDWLIDWLIIEQNEETNQRGSNLTLNF